MSNAVSALFTILSSLQSSSYQRSPFIFVLVWGAHAPRVHFSAPPPKSSSQTPWIFEAVQKVRDGEGAIADTEGRVRSPSSEFTFALVSAATLRNGRENGSNRRDRNRVWLSG